MASSIQRFNIKKAAGEPNGQFAELSEMTYLQACRSACVYPFAFALMRNAIAGAETSFPLPFEKATKACKFKIRSPSQEKIVTYLEPPLRDKVAFVQDHDVLAGFDRKKSTRRIVRVPATLQPPLFQRTWSRTRDKSSD